MKEICERAWWVKFSKAVKPIWKVMKFRLLHCSWAHHPEMEPDFRTNVICIEESTWRPVFQRHLESCSCQGDSYGQIFKEPKHPVYWELLKDTDHLFFMPKRTYFKKSSVTEVFWAPVRSHKRWSGDGSQRMLLWPPADPEAGQGWHSHRLRGWEHAGCPQGGQPMHCPPQQAPLAARWQRGNGDHILENMALCQRYHICYLATIRLSFVVASHTSPRRGDGWTPIHSQVSGKKSQWSGLCCLLITGITGLGASEPCWACGVHHPLIYQIFSFCKLFISQREQNSGKHPAYDLFKKIFLFYCCRPYIITSFSVSQFTTLFQSPKLTITIHKRVIF